MKKISFFDALFKTIGEALFEGLIISKDGLLVDFNDQFLMMTGYQRAELIGMDISDIIYEEDRERTMDGIISGREGLMEGRLCDKQGRVMAVEARSKMLNCKGELFRFTAIRDLTNQIRMEEELRRSHENLELRVNERTAELNYQRKFLQTVIDNIPVIFALHTKQRQTPVINKEFETLTGWSQNDVDQTDIMAELYPDPDYRQEILEYMAYPGPFWKDMNMLARDGRILETRWMNVKLSEDAQIGIGIDMTERNRMEAQLRQSQKMEAIGSLSGGIAHDFNNILAAITGFSEMIEEDLPENSPLRPYIKNVLQASFRGRDLVKQILAFSRKAKHVREPVSLWSVIEETNKLLRASIPATIHIELKNETTADHVWASAVEVQQIVMNLATNAARAMNKNGGILLMSLSEISFKTCIIDGEIQPGDYLELRVQDTGIGMTREVMARLFEPFFTTSRTGEGIGMGLAVVYGIIKSLDGAITVESKPYHGSTFRVYFPLIKNTVQPEDESGNLLPKGTERILFVDDEEPLAQLGHDSLEKLGYKVKAVTDSQEALKLFQADPYAFDLVITDQTMPEINGLHLAKKMLRTRNEIPIILCTGHSDVVSPEIARAAGIKKLFMKPLTRNELALAIRSVLDGQEE